MACWNYMVELIVLVFCPTNGSIVLPGCVSKFGLSIESFYLESKYGDSIWNFVSKKQDSLLFLTACFTAKLPWDM